MAFLQTNPTIHNPSLHRRNDSGELAVFEAAHYFSAESPATAEFIQRSTARMSLDVPGFRNPVRPSGIDLAVDHSYKRQSSMIGGHGAAKYKQPRSPGARLANFLNSLFSPTASKNHKKKSTKPSSVGDDDSGCRRKRRSSISHFIGIGSIRSAVSASITPTKSYKEEVRNFPELRHKVPGNHRSGTAEQRSRFSNVSTAAAGNLGIIEKLGFSGRNSADGKFSNADDGADTDSSSDLFDLPSHELDFYSNGLPVYGTTSIDRIRIIAPL